MDKTEAVAPGRSVPVILGGGGGTRLWPVSRDSFPKQFLKILEPTSSLQQAMLRTSAKDIFARPIVMTIDPYRFLVRQQLEEIGCDAEIVIEPERRDSGPAILAAALLVPPETVLFVSAADHLIENKDGLLADFRNAAMAAQDGALVTFGIAPSRATGAYGYIRPGEPLDGIPEVERVGALRREARRRHGRAAVSPKAALLEQRHVRVPRRRAARANWQRFDPDIVQAVRAASPRRERDLGFLRLDTAAFARAPPIRSTTR